MTDAEPTFEELLSEARALASALAVERIADGVPDAHRFMLAIYRIGRHLTRDPSLRESAEFRQFVTDTEGLLGDAFLHIDHFAERAESRLIGEWVYDEWRRSARDRSALQFYLELYRPTSLAPLLHYIEGRLPDHDERLAAKIQNNSGSDGSVPWGIPGSHWWWHGGEPPAP
jgi:hypothetical protein